MIYTARLDEDTNNWYIDRSSKDGAYNIKNLITLNDVTETFARMIAFELNQAYALDR